MRGAAAEAALAPHCLFREEWGDFKVNPVLFEAGFMHELRKQSSPSLTHPKDPPLALPAARAAQRCGVSRSQWWKLHSAGKVPPPVYLGSRAPRWRVADLDAWLAAGCPTRQQWQHMQGAQR